jgi:hypothetical protein
VYVFSTIGFSNANIKCNVVVSGDPKTENLIYHLDSRTFEFQGEPDLSVVHVRCNLPTPLKSRDYLNGYNSTDGISHYTSDDATDAFALGYADQQFENGTRAASPPLNDTDFEQELHIIFQVSEQPRKLDFEGVRYHAAALGFNSDLLWIGVRDGSMSKEEVEYQDYTGSSAQRAYRKLHAKVDYREILYKENFEEDTQMNYTSKLSPKAANITASNDYKFAGPWFGEVSRMVFWRSQITAREFMWTLNNTSNNSDDDKTTVQAIPRKACL